MPSRQELALRARMCNIDVSAYPNDSELERAVLFAEKNAAAAAGTATVLAADAEDVAAVSGDEDV